MSGRPSRAAYDRVLQQAIRALPQLPAVFTPKQLQRVMPDRSMNQCRRLMQKLVARGYCTPVGKHTVAPQPAVLPVETPTDRILALVEIADKHQITVRQAMGAVDGSRRAVYRLLERMTDLGLIRRLPASGCREPRMYGKPLQTQRARIAVPAGCHDPHCQCPVAESDFDYRGGRLTRVICRRHETHTTERFACLT